MFSRHLLSLRLIVSLVRIIYDPFTEFGKLYDDVFNARFRPSHTIEGNTTLTQCGDWAFPRLDLHENAEIKTVSATFKLPGIKQQDVNVEVHGNHLTISRESKRSGGSYAVQECSCGKFSRTLQIRQGIKASTLAILTVCFPKAGPDHQPQRIAIA
ncbi:small heat shock protein [Suillus subalutaceus]|uniref:small heat shock protein n=1 Tax=Suillus subalutaceus TaxID=48586 RepID=UPI001B86D3DF|nr:small heat shock protein [Suillus subalutaceus]KAG1858760.1 small heat shock protein [Suillus subalutaceus]